MGEASALLPVPVWPPAHLHSSKCLLILTTRGHGPWERSQEHQVMRGARDRKSHTGFNRKQNCSSSVLSRAVFCPHTLINTQKSQNVQELQMLPRSGLPQSSPRWNCIPTVWWFREIFLPVWTWRDQSWWGRAALILQRKEGERSSAAHRYGLNMSQDSTVPGVLIPSRVCRLKQVFTDKNLVRTVWKGLPAGEEQHHCRKAPAFKGLLQSKVFVFNKTNIRCQRHLLAVRVLRSFIWCRARPRLVHRGCCSCR